MGGLEINQISDELSAVTGEDYIEVEEKQPDGSYVTKKFKPGKMINLSNTELVHNQNTDDALAGITAADLVIFKESQLYNGLHTPTDWTVTYAEGTRTITAVVGAATKVNANGNILTIEAATYTRTHAAATGKYLLVVLSDGTIRFDSSFDILTEAIVAYVYYNHTTGLGIPFDERHPVKSGWPAGIHKSHHETVGAVIVSGGAITGITEGSNLNDSMQLSISSLVFDDESKRNILSELIGGAGKYTVFYRSGNDGANEWSWYTSQDLPLRTISENPTYNQLSGGNWGLTEITNNNRWVNYYLIGTNAFGAIYHYLLIPGQTLHSTLGAAEAEDFIGSISFGGLVIAETPPLAKLTFRRASAGSGNNFYIDKWVNIRGTKANLSVTTIPSSHNSFADRDASGSHPASAISFGEDSNVATELGLKVDLNLAYEFGNISLGDYSWAEDDTKNWTSNEWAGYPAILKTTHGDYQVDITTNDPTGFSFNLPVDAPTSAIVTIEDTYELGVLIISCIGSLEGNAGNDVDIILQLGTNDTSTDTIVWDEITKTLTIVIDSDGLGNPRPIMTGNVETLINEDVTVSSLFFALMANAGNLVVGTYTTSGGADGNKADGTYYIQKMTRPLVLETDAKLVDYTLLLTDKNKIVPMNNTGAAFLTVPSNADVPFTVGTVIGIYPESTDNVTVIGAEGVVVRNAGILTQYHQIYLRKRQIDEWVLIGTVT